jgi:hypothetical protein
MKKLVSLFQEKLDVSVKNATYRVIGVVVVLICAVATLVAAIGTFPFASNLTERISLLPGNYTQVDEIRDGDVMVNTAQFLQMAKGSVSFVSLEGCAIVYMTKVGGISYRHEDAIDYNLSYYNASSRIENGVMVREMERSVAEMIFVHIILPLLFLFTLLLIFVRLEGKRLSGWGSNAKYATVWI